MHRVGGITSSLARVDGGISSSLERVEGGITSSLHYVSGINASLRKVSGITCRMGLVCKPDIGSKYLVIEPTVIWVYPDMDSTNDVYSNTHWIVQ